MEKDLMKQLLADVEESAKGRAAKSTEVEKQRKRNLARNINDIAGMLYKMFSWNGEALKMTYDNAEKVSRMIMSEVLGYNTADLEEPVDEKLCNKADDILAQIRAKQVVRQRSKDEKVSIPKPAIDFKEIARIANELTAQYSPDPTPRQPNVDPFDDAMSIMEKK